MTATDTDRPIRTFHPRRGRMSTRHADATARLWPVYGLTVVDGDRTPLDLGTLFGRDAPRVLEIGFGMGDATAAMAAADPGRDYLAAEVHTPGIGNLLALVDEQGLTNVRVAHGDAVELVHRIPAGALDAIHVFFPDPWPKARHHKRRLIRPGIVALLRERLRVGGVLHCATDWPEYAQSMARTLAADPGLREVTAEDIEKHAARAGHAPSHDRPGHTADGPGAANPDPATHVAANPDPASRGVTGHGTADRGVTGHGAADRGATGHDAADHGVAAVGGDRGRPETKFERRGRQAGRPITDLVFRRV